MSCKLFDLTGKNAVVIGGAGGIGQAVAQGLAEAGANVAIASRKEESLIRAAQGNQGCLRQGCQVLHRGRHRRESVAACAQEGQRGDGRG